MAAGIINPITGRRYVKSWRVADLLPFAQQIYQRLEAELGIDFYHERPLIRTLFNRGEENDWQARQLEEDYQPYYYHPPNLDEISTLTEPAFGYMQVAQTAQVSIGVLENTLRYIHLTQGRLLLEAFDFKQLKIQRDQANYQSINYDQIIFCEGWRGRKNPYFNYLPFGGNKGEVLLVRLTEGQLQRMFKHRVFIVPFEDDLYWIGSTSENRFGDDKPTESNGQYLHERLAEVLKVPFEVVHHRAAVRPTVRDRRPFLGRHPEYPQLAIFNGLGTKGASLGPYWASHLVQHLLYGEALDAAVDIGRFRGGERKKGD